MKGGTVLLFSSSLFCFPAVFLLSATLRLHVPFIIALSIQLIKGNPRHLVKFVAAVFHFPRAAVSLSHAVIIHSNQLSFLG